MRWALALLLACPGGAWAQDAWPGRLARKAAKDAAGKKRKLKKRFDARARDAMLAAARVWYPTAPEAAELAGTPAFFPRRYDRHAVLRCDYLDEETGGTTPKFKCVVHDGPNAGREIKVKYRTPDRSSDEVHTEIAATRLLWALGFGADFMYPIDRLICRGCPADPHRGGEIVPFQAFDHVVVEEKFGKKIRDAAGESGWSWDALEAQGATTLPPAAWRAQLDALRLLMVLLRHYDNKAENQRLACLKADITEAGTCAAPHLLVQDVGGTFGPGWNGAGAALAKWWRQESVGRRLSNKYNLAGWAEQRVWKDPARCVADLERWTSAVAGLRDPRISEAGRAFLADLLGRLRRNPQGLVALFRAARFDRPRAWAAAFWAKADRIIGHRCPR